MTEEELQELQEKLAKAEEEKRALEEDRDRWKHHSRTNEDKFKEKAKLSDELNAKLEEIRNSNLTDEEKKQRELDEKIAEAARHATEAASEEVKKIREELAAKQLEAAKAQIVNELGIPGGLHKFVTGSTVDEITQNAKELAESVEAQAPRLPKPDNSQGQKKSPPQDLIAEAARKGDWEEFRRLTRRQVDALQQ